VIADHVPWFPHTHDERESVLRELREILASPHFCNSKRYPALLKFIVETTVEGKSYLLKERTLGIEVFDRSPTYDTNSDTVVRYTAGEVRKRLQLYYLEHPSHSGIRIALPAGSYVPEFHTETDRHDEDGDFLGSEDPQPRDALHRDSASVPDSLLANGSQSSARTVNEEQHAVSAIPSPAKGRIKPLAWLIAAAVLAAVAIVAGVNWNSRAVRSQSAVEDFWMPLVHDNHTVLLCTGSVVFAKNEFSGVITAGKDIDYPFVSMQIASSIAQISGTLSHFGVTTQLLSSASTPLTDLREHSITLLGGYNNDWTMRLLQPLRFHFTQEPVESIVDSFNPQVHWQRDHSLPYSSADDYALLARFRDPTIDGWVVVVAGLGRNGTEAASQFAVSPHYMQLLQNRLGSDIANQNLEVVLKVKVIDGKTGAPSILAVRTW